MPWLALCRLIGNGEGEKEMGKPLGPRRCAGIGLILAAIVFAAAFQWLGPGLVVTRSSTYPIVVEGRAGTATVTRRTYHYALIPPTLVGIIGLVLVALPRRG